MNDMKVVIGIPGRGASTLYLARELFKKGFLAKFITSYPKLEIAKYGLPGSVVESLIAKEVFQRSWSHLPNFLKDRFNWDYFLSEIFDKAAAKRIVPADIFWGWISSSLRSLREARKKGALTYFIQELVRVIGEWESITTLR